MTYRSKNLVHIENTTALLFGFITGDPGLSIETSFRILELARQNWLLTGCIIRDPRVVDWEGGLVSGSTSPSRFIDKLTSASRG